MKQYASPCPSTDFIGLLMDLTVTKTGLRHLSELMTRRGNDYTAATVHTFPRPNPTRQASGRLLRRYVCVCVCLCVFNFSDTSSKNFGLIFKISIGASEIVN